MMETPDEKPPSKSHAERARVELFVLVVVSALVPVLTVIGTLDKWLQYALGGAVAMLLLSFGVSTLRAAFYRKRGR